MMIYFLMSTAFKHFSFDWEQCLFLFKLIKQTLLIIYVIATETKITIFLSKLIISIKSISNGLNKLIKMF